MTALLEVRELSTVFHTRAGDIAAVNKVSYRLDAGRSLAIVGESGSGKTVNALSLMGLVPSPGAVVGGQVLFEGRNLLDIDAADWQKVRGASIAMIFQDPMTSLNPVLTIERQLADVLRWHQGLSKDAARRKIIEALSRVGIPDAEGRLVDYPHQFSGGQRQRIMIAMAIVCGPSLLIADEPTTALDVTVQAQIVGLIEELRSTLGMAVIWITHDLALIANVVDEVAVMYAGSIVEQGPVEAVFGNPRHPYTVGLMASMPDITAPQQKRLASIDGTPPDLAALPAGCAFAPRCNRCVEQCLREKPQLGDAGPHRAACWRVGAP